MSSKKFFSVSIPVSSHVTVLVQAEDENEADDIASWAACLSDAEPIDFVLDQADIAEIKIEELSMTDQVYINKKEYRTGRYFLEKQNG